MSQIETEKIRPTTGNSKTDGIPTISKWKNESMIRRHSIRAAVKEIVMKSKNRDVIKVGIIGEPHTGKSTQLDTIGHLEHIIAKKMFNVDFAVRTYTRDDFVDIEETIQNLPPGNFILKFQDLSFLKASHGSKKVEKLEQNMTEIRHLDGRKGDKYIINYDYHYNKGLPPYLRQSDFKFFTGIGSSEKDNMDEITGGKYFNKVLLFKKMSDKAPTTEKFTFKLGMKGFFTYKYRNPFIPMLFWNEDSLRFVVSPTRQWIDPLCSTCAMSDDTKETEIDLDNMLAVGSKAFGPVNLHSAIKLKLRANGINVYKKDVTNAEKWLNKIMEKKHINIEDLAVKCGFTPTKTKLRKSIDEVVNFTPAE